MRSFLRILNTTSTLWPLYVGIMVCSVLTTAAMLGVPFVVKAATDVVVESLGGEVPGVVGTVVTLALVLLALELLGAVVQNVGGYFGDVMGARMSGLLSARYYQKLLGLPQSYFDNTTTGTIVARLNRTIHEISQFWIFFSNNLLSMLLTTTAVLVIAAIYYWPLAVLLILLYPAYMWITTWSSKRWQELEGQKNAERDAAVGRFTEVMSQVPVVKSFVRQSYELGRLTDHYARVVGITRTQSTHWHIMDASRRAVLGAIFFGVYALLFVRTAQQHMTVGDMVLLVQLIPMAKQPVASMSFFVDITQRAMAGSREYFSVLDEPVTREHRELAGGLGAEPLRWQPNAPAISFSGVTFRYESTGRDVLRDVTFDVGAGQKVALVSASGGGKSTIVSLLLGLYPPGSGSITVGGHDISTAQIAAVRDQIAVVFQEATLFSGTIADNIAYGDLGADRAAVVEAARKAHADEFISEFADGYDTLVGERGVKLSGGQRQRIAIARAMLRDAPILVLDEATSALDTKSERAVQAGLDSLMSGRTSVIIAHRLSTISHADVIVTLDRGVVDEIGSPHTLAGTGGIYSELLTLQASSSLADRKRLAEFGFTED